MGDPMRHGTALSLATAHLLVAAPASAQDDPLRAPDYRRLGIAAYGVDPFRTPEAERGLAHGNDERVSVANVRYGVEFYFRLVEKLAR